MKFSIVAACYNSEPFIDDFFRSLFSQTLGYRACEVIAVDDGSTDGTGKRIEAWRARYPHHVRHLRQENAGQASARNHGLRVARGAWVSFIDPDDFVSDDHLAHVEKELARDTAGGVCMIATNLIIYLEDSHLLSDSHPLAFKYSASRVELRVNDLNQRIQLGANNAWFELRNIRKHRLRFDTRIRPTFEDADFVARYLIRNLDRSVVYLKEPKYYYRKRRNAGSTVDVAQRDPRHYDSEVRLGHLRLLRDCHRKLGSVPVFIQYTVLYHLLFRMRLFYQDSPEVEFLSVRQQDEFHRLLRKVFSFVSVQAVLSFRAAGFSALDYVGLLGLFKDHPVQDTAVTFEKSDPPLAAFQFSFLSRDARFPVTPFVNGNACVAGDVTTVPRRFCGRDFCYQHYFWLSIRPSEAFWFEVGGEKLRQRVGKDLRQPIQTREQLLHSLGSRIRSSLGLGIEDRRLRSFVRRGEAAAMYGGSWLLVDRPQFAGDNAEHLYRHLSRLRKAPSIFFALSRTSADWPRLSREGFRLVDFGSWEYLSALANCGLFVCSNLYDRPQAIADLCGYRVVFLQHGVTKDNQSRWFNGHDIDLLLCATEDERKGFLDPTNGYRVSPREVVLTGFPRHDHLSRLRHRKRFVTVMPTWRKSLSGATEREFRGSSYFRRWARLLASPAFEDISRRHGQKPSFVIHPGMMRFRALFEKISPGIAFVEPGGLGRLFADSALLVTDYSSVAFDFAYMNKPVVYYQFDAAAFYSGSHTYRRGYHDYARDGFGPVATTFAQLLRNIEAALDGREESRYAVRRSAAFRFHDEESASRVHDAMLTFQSGEGHEPGTGF